MRRTTIAAIPVLALAAAIIAGPLDPPAGPVAPTYKTLTEVEPRIAINAANTPGDADSVFRISQPGSYYLAASFTGEPSKKCIEIAANDVTIDLNGMTITGDATSTAGIFAENVRIGLTVRNGTVRDVGAGLGIGFSISACRGWTVENVTAYNNAGNGIWLPNGSIAKACLAANNSGRGIRVGDNCQVVECIAYDNTLAGVEAGSASVVTRCVTRDNTGDGINVASDGVRVLDCTSYGNDGNGIIGLNGAHITGCIVRNNTLNGIATNASSVIERNDVTFSGGHGISVLNNCIVRDNVSDQNGQSTLGAGIFASSSRNRIEGNSCPFKRLRHPRRHLRKLHHTKRRRLQLHAQLGHRVRQSLPGRSVRRRRSHQRQQRRREPGLDRSQREFYLLGRRFW